MKRETLKEQIMGKCRHFNGTMNKVCKVGIKYDDVKTQREPGKGYSLPCLLDAGAKTCEQCSPLTEAEADAEIEEHRLRMVNTGIARKAITDQCGLWSRGVGKSGDLPCPVCKNGILRYARAGSNGHVHAQCSTPKCVCWME